LAIQTEIIERAYQPAVPRFGIIGNPNVVPRHDLLGGNRILAARSDKAGSNRKRPMDPVSG
jgi:hypothetical protein